MILSVMRITENSVLNPTGKDSTMSYRINTTNSNGISSLRVTHSILPPSFVC
jgi:hypothetical protein